jgi:hypothetical protein
MNDRFQPPKLPGISEHPLAQNPAINHPISGEYSRTEASAKFLLDAFIVQDFMPDPVYIDLGEAQFFDKGDQGIFSGTVPSGNTENKCGANGCPPRSVPPPG